MGEPALMPRRPAGHASFVGEPDTEGLRRLRCAIAAGPALREARLWDGWDELLDRAGARALDVATRADRANDEAREDR